MKIVAIIQARMSSSRLPGKVLKEICGKSVLAHVVRRVQLCSLLDQVVVATTIGEEDNVIVQEAENLNVTSFRGSRDNVLSRYYHAAKEQATDVVVRITSDCPLLDPQVLTELIGTFLKKNCEKRSVDYLSNTLDRSYPRGLDAEVFYFEALETAFLNAQKDYEKEHVTPYLYQNRDKFVIEQLKNGQANYSDYRWTLDTPDDFKFIELVYNAIWEEGRFFQAADIYRLLERNPRLLKINSHIEQKKLGE